MTAHEKIDAEFAMIEFFLAAHPDADAVELVKQLRVKVNSLCTDEFVQSQRLRIEVKGLKHALRNVIGDGYMETKHPASQDYVSKSAIGLVRSVLGALA